MLSVSIPCIYSLLQDPSSPSAANESIEAFKLLLLLHSSPPLCHLSDLPARQQALLELILSAATLPAVKLDGADPTSGGGQEDGAMSLVSFWELQCRFESS